MLQDYPHSPSTTFLKPEEKAYLQERLKLDSDGLSLEFKRKFILQAFLDYKVWIFAFMYQVSAVHPNGYLLDHLVDCRCSIGMPHASVLFQLVLPYFDCKLGILSCTSSTAVGGKYYFPHAPATPGLMAFARSPHMCWPL